MCPPCFGRAIKSQKKAPRIDLTGRAFLYGGVVPRNRKHPCLTGEDTVGVIVHNGRIRGRRGRPRALARCRGEHGLRFDPKRGVADHLQAFLRGHLSAMPNAHVRLSV